MATEQEKPDKSERIKEARTQVLSGRRLFNKIDCFVVLVDKNKKARPKFVKHKKVNFGAKSFSVWRGMEKRTYYIDYEQLIEGTKSFLYFTGFSNSVSPLSFYEYPAEKYGDELDPRNAENMLYDGTVEVFKAKRGIPLWLVAVLGIGMFVGIIATMITLQLYMGEARLNDSLDAQILTLKNQIAVLQGGTAIG